MILYLQEKEKKIILVLTMSNEAPISNSNILKQLSQEKA